MNTVAIVAPDFSPSSMPPALRARFFAAHLREFGWEPIVIATESRHYEWDVDPDNDRLFDSACEVVRTGAFSAKWTRKFGLGDLGLRSLWHNWRALRKLCQSRKVDLVFIPVPPFYSMMLGRLANLRFETPYVIDYIDPYVTDYYKKVPKAQRPPKWRMAYEIAKIVEPFSVRRAAHIVSVDRSYTAGVIGNYSWFDEGDSTGIPYGGEPGDFDYLRKHPRRNPIFDRSDGLLHVSYVGRGGPDMEPALRAVFCAFKRVMDKSPGIYGKVRIHFVGTDYAPAPMAKEQVMPLAAELGVGGYIEEHPARVSYLDALQVLLESDALLVVGSTEAHYTASKIFPYILAERPLLGVFHEDSSVVRIVRETNAGKVITFKTGESPLQKVEQIEEALGALVAGQAPTVQWNAFEPYTARAMAQKLARVFDNIIGRTTDKAAAR